MSSFIGMVSLDLALQALSWKTLNNFFCWFISLSLYQGLLKIVDGLILEFLPNRSFFLNSHINTFLLNNMYCEFKSTFMF